jgi:ankyrin repeat protein
VKHLLPALAVCWSLLAGGDTLRDAIARDDVAAVRAVLDARPEALEEQGAGRRTPLHAAARESALGVAELLLERGASLAALDAEHRRPLHYVRQPELARLFLAHGAQPCRADGHWETPWEVAVRMRRRSLAELYIAGGCTPSLLDLVYLRAHDALARRLAAGADPSRARMASGWRRDETPLAAAVGIGDVEAARLLLAAGAELPRTIRVDYDWGGLPKAVLRGDLAMVELLLEHDAPVDVEIVSVVTASSRLTTFAAAESPRELARRLFARSEQIDLAEDQGLAPLHAAAARGRAGVVEDLLELGAGVNIWASNLSALRCACLGGHLELARELVARGAWHDVYTACALDDVEALGALLDEEPDRLEARDESARHTPAIWAASFGAERALRLLLERGAAVDEAIPREDGDDRSYRPTFDLRVVVRGTRALHAAAGGGHLGCVRLLLERGADPDGLDEEGGTALLRACVWDRVEVARLLLDAGADPDAGGSAPLRMAAGSGRPELVRLLLAVGADVERRDDRGHTALDFAAGRTWKRAEGRDPEGAAQLLLEHGATPSFGAACALGLEDVLRASLEREAALGETALDSWPFGARTPIRVAALHGRIASVRALRDAGVSLGREGREPQPLHDAAEAGHAGLVAWLLDEGGLPLEQHDGSGRTPLLAAAKGGSVEVVQLLLARGADARATDVQGRSALHLAVGLDPWGSGDAAGTVALLLRADCDPGALDASGRTPLHAAARALQTEAVELLLAAGAPVNATDLQGHTALALARELRKHEPIEGERRFALANLLVAHGAVE